MRTNGSRMAAWVSATALATASCGGAAAFHRCYPGAPLPREQIALVENVRGAHIQQIDGQGPAWRSASQVAELAPGQHTLCVGYLREHAGGNGATVSRGCQPLRLAAAAGRMYAIYVVVAGNRWEPAAWDVTDELDARELEAFGNVAIETANRARPESAKLASPAIRRAQPLQGFGEKRAARIRGWRGPEVEVEYAFDRYQPFVRTARASDGITYLLEISQKTGGVAGVVGRYVDCDVGPLMNMAVLQLVGSDVAAEGWLMCKEGPVDRFTKIANPNNAEIQVPLGSPWPSMP